MRLPASAKWVALALAGLAIAIGVAVAAANLTSQQIGIASESVSAGDSLAPSLKVPREKPRGEGGDRRGPEEERSTTGPSEPEPPTTTSEEPVSPSEPPAEQGSDDYGGSGSDGDD